MKQIENINKIENLSNELIYEIFEFLNYHHAFQAFYDLNQRFENLFLNSNIPIKINISTISKSKFEYFTKHIIKPNAYRIELIRLSNPCIDPCLLLIPIMKNLTQLTTLILNNIESNYIEKIVNNLFCLPVLSSLTRERHRTVFFVLSCIFAGHLGTLSCFSGRIAGRKNLRPGRTHLQDKKSSCVLPAGRIFVLQASKS
ncbi:unnamed protein product [Rotaria sp. Silwood2]|nr:unnamed protein product [Rotaria sp. Silwood2]CAF3323995.1 unnamed protein product [Rotaria sp. Silwood2]CAF4140514.1 unnamed protein product [Rotaria sp. Silwood2]CAF4196558.1 unnamed protein product [Rotaria sp. Silwood2]